MARNTSSMEGSKLDKLTALNAVLIEKIRELATLKKRDQKTGSEGIRVDSSSLNRVEEAEIEKLTGDIESERERCRKISTEKDVIGIELSRRVEEADRLKARVQGTEEKEKMRENKIFVLKDEIDRFKNEKRSMEEEVIEYQEKNLTWGEGHSLRDEIAEIVDEKYAIENEKTELLFRIGALEEQTERVDEGGDVGDGFDRFAIEKDSLVKAMDSVKRELESKNKLIAKLNYEKTELEKVSKEQESEIEGLIEKVMKLAKANFEAKHAAGATAAKVSQDRSTMLTARSALMNDKLERLERKKASLKSRVAEMESLMENEKAEHGVIVKRLEEQLKAEKKGKISICDMVLLVIAAFFVFLFVSALKVVR